MKELTRILSICFLLGSCFGQDAEESDRRALFAGVAASRILPQPSVRGDDSDWFFLVKELRHLSLGRFWEKPWKDVAANANDPIPSILEFHALLAKRGIRLILVPIPAKAGIYPDKLATGFKPGEAEPLAPLLERIRAGGVNVIDLEPHFLAMREASPEKWLYCRQDAHFSPAAIELVAKLVAEEAGMSAPNPAGGFTLSGTEMLKIEGDQVAGSEWAGSVAPESVAVRYVKSKGGEPVVPDPESPLLLLGDSHTLVFQAGKEGGMHCSGAGVFDHLSERFGFAADLVAVRGSGLVQARKQLFYRAASTPGYWDSKKVVVWLFSAREFTQSSDKPIAIPLER